MTLSYRGVLSITGARWGSIDLVYSLRSSVQGQIDLPVWYIYDISQFLHYNFWAFLKLTLLLCKTTEHFNEKKSIKWNSRMHIDMHVISVKFSFQFANTVISRIGTTHTEDTFRSFPSSNFRTSLFKLCT